MPQSPQGRLSGPAIVLLVAATLLPVGAGPLSAQAGQPSHHAGLGSLSFPNSGAPEARDAFERGVLLMHSFEYEDAAAAFREAQHADPDFAMAYWGEAMTHNHPVWNQQDREAALAVLERYAPTPEARAARAPTDRERMYMEAVDVLYGPGTKEARDTAYARAMEELVETWPDDFEAHAFHALAILGLSRGERNVPSYMRAGARALSLFQRNPDHPGAAHYVIHSFDDPTHAPLGLEAAEAYADVAPDAAHAQHMTTHIFLALGQWDGVVAANERADAVVDRGLEGKGQKPTDCGHYNEWLAYGYQQQGRLEDARALVMGCLEQAAGGGSLRAADNPRFAVSATGMRALYLASTEDFDGAVARRELALDGLSPTERETVELVQAWASGYAAAGRGDAVEARRRLQAFEERVASDPQVISYWAAYVPVWRGTLRSVVAAAEGDVDTAIRAAHEAAEHEAGLPVDFGPPTAWKPPRELEGEMLLEAGRAEEALAAFRAALGRTPRRALALEGYARAAEATGEPALADEARTELADVRAPGG